MNTNSSKINRLPHRGIPRIKLFFPLFLLSLMTTFGCKGCLRDEVPDPPVPSNNQGGNTNHEPSSNNNSDPKPNLKPGHVNSDFPDEPPQEEFPDDPDDAFKVSSITPNFGPLEGGNEVRLNGTGLPQGVRLFFGTHEADVRYDSQLLIVATAPPSDFEQQVTLKLIHPSGEVILIEKGYSYQEKLQVKRATPSRVSTKGESRVTIDGTGFVEPIAVTVGDESVLGYRRLSTSQLEVSLPKHTRGTVPIRVTTSHDTKELDPGVTYVDVIQHVTVTPASGPTAGGSSVTLTVDQLAVDPNLPTNGVRVFFGDVEAQISNIDANKQTVTIVTPPGHGSVPVRVETVDDAYTQPQAFLYTNNTIKPELLAVEPAIGPNSGENIVYLTGANLQTPNLIPLFGSSPATIISQHPSKIEVKVPQAQIPGETVDVSLNDQSQIQLSLLSMAYQYVETSAITGFSPLSGTALGGTEVTFRGQNCDAISSLFFGGVEAIILSRTSTELVVATPQHRPGDVDIEVRYGDHKDTLSQTYTYHADERIWGFAPSKGSIAGGTRVEIYGIGFASLQHKSFDVLVGDKHVKNEDIEIKDDHRMIIMTPPSEPKEVKLSIAQEGGKTVQSTQLYTYFNPANRYGGTSGANVDGSVNITVASYGGSPISGAYVFISTAQGQGAPAQTDGNGQVTLSRKELVGATTISAYAPGYSMTTIQSVDAENITIFLVEVVPPPPPGQGNAAYGRFHGVVTASGKLEMEDTDLSVDLAYVKTTRSSTGAFSFDPGPKSMVIGMGNSYEIYTHLGDQAVVAICGHYDNKTEEFTPLLMGVKRYQFIADKDYKEVNIDCTIPLSESIRVKLVNASYSPLGPTGNTARVYWDFGFDGVFDSPLVGKSYSPYITVGRQPKASPQLEGMKYVIRAGSDTNGSFPYAYSMKVVDELPNKNSYVVMPELVDVPTPLEPSHGGVLQEQVRFATAGVESPDFWWLTLKDQDNLVLYEVLLPGNETNFYLPLNMINHRTTQTETSGLTQAMSLTVLGGKMSSGHSINEWDYRYTNTSRLTSYSMNIWPVIYHSK